MDSPGDALRRALAEADEIYAASQVPGDGLPVDPDTVSMPNLANSEVITVRLPQPELDRLRAAAAARGVVVGDGVRAAALLWLRQHPTAADYAAMAESYDNRG